MSPTGSMLPPGIPERVGAYRILSVLGEGAMGVVCLAEQTEPVVRKVALKILKPGTVSSDQFLARFEAERQALALMEHDSIARIYEAGTTPAGVPYFAMELIRGVPITSFCDRNRLPITKRLKLLAEICRAVQHAHQKGIIHRDLKPTNILVADSDDGPLPKVIDFGIAKAMDLRLSERTLQTETGVVIGTPAYMSPEQMESPGRDIDTRADVYSLGILLYELLVGRLPFDDAEIRGLAGLYTLSHKDPPTPRARFTSFEMAHRDSIATNRRIATSALAKQLGGDLNWITMKAIERDRGRRYQTAYELAADIGRYLSHEPVTARGPSVRYRTAKFVRRHRVGVAATLMVAAALLSSTILATLGLVRATRAEARATAEATTAEEVTDLMVDLFLVSDPGEALGETITAREVMDRGVPRVRTDLQNQPAVKARLLQALGRVYFNLGLYDQAKPLLEDALALQTELDGTNSDAHGVKVAEGLTDLAHVFWKESNLPRAESLLVLATTGTDWTEDTDQEELARAHFSLGVIYASQGRYDEAEKTLLEALEIWEGLEPADYENMGKALNSLGGICLERGQLGRAAAYFERALEAKQLVLGAGDPSLAATYHNLGILYYEERRYEKAEKAFERAIEINTTVHGEDHLEVADNLDALGGVKAAQGLYDDAEQLGLRALEIRRAQLEPGHSDFAFSHNALANLYSRRGEHERALPHFDEATSIFAANFGSDHAFVGFNVGSQAVSLRELGRHEEAEIAFSRALAILEASVAPDHPDLLSLRQEYAAFLRRAGRRVEVESHP